MVCHHASHPAQSRTPKHGPSAQHEAEYTIHRSATISHALAVLERSTGHPPNSDQAALLTNGGYAKRGGGTAAVWHEHYQTAAVGGTPPAGKPARVGMRWRLFSIARIDGCPAIPCQTELAQKWPEYIVSAWIGNTLKVAREHYLQVTEEHFKRASKCASASNRMDSNSAERKPSAIVASSVAAKRCNPLQLQGVTEEWAIQGSNLVQKKTPNQLIEGSFKSI